MDVEDQVEAADLEDLGDHRPGRGHDDLAAACPSLVGGEHEAAQPARGDVVQPREVEDDALPRGERALEVRLQLGAEGVAALVVEAAGRGDHQRVCEGAGIQGHCYGSVF
ncbi:hypothetical protein D3C83_56940 [compost metagenome]